MRTITKSPEPPALAAARRTARLGGRQVSAADWPPSGAESTQAIRSALHHDQGGLCAYCCATIKARLCFSDPAGREVPAADRAHPARGGMIIEHWIPRRGFKDSDEAEKVECGTHALEWTNLLGVCVGVSLGPGTTKEHHCDAARENRRLLLHPSRTPDLAARFKVNNHSGKIDAAQDDLQGASSDIGTLNLNCGRLKANRATAIAQVRARLRQDDSARSFRHQWRLATSANDGVLPPYAPAVQLYLAPKLRARNISV